MNSLPVEEKFGQIFPARNKAKLSEWCESGHCLMLLPVFAMAPQLTGVSEASLHGEAPICRLFATATSSTGVSEASPHDKPPIYRLFATAASSTGVSEASLHGEAPIWRLFATSVALAGETDGQLRGCQGKKESG